MQAITIKQYHELHGSFYRYILNTMNSKSVASEIIGLNGKVVQMHNKHYASHSLSTPHR